MQALDPADPLAEAAAYQIGVAVPGPLSARLDALVRCVHNAGQQTNRKELLAALVLAAPENQDGLQKLLRSYRLATIADAFVADEDPDTFLQPERPRGPRRPPRARRPPSRARRRSPRPRRRPSSGDEDTTH